MVALLNAETVAEANQQKLRADYRDAMERIVFQARLAENAGQPDQMLKFIEHLVELKNKLAPSQQTASSVEKRVEALGSESSK